MAPLLRVCDTVLVVDRARQSWIRKLIDLSRRNNLLYYRPLKTGTLDLSFADSSGMAALLRGVEAVSVGKLLPNGKDESIRPHSLKHSGLYLAARASPRFWPFSHAWIFRQLGWITGDSFCFG
jgi:hypothetical protein